MRSARETDLQQLYRNRFAYGLEARAEIWGVLVCEFFQAWVRRSDTVVDLACADSAQTLNPGTEFYETCADRLDFFGDGSQKELLRYNDFQVVGAHPQFLEVRQCR